MTGCLLYYKPQNISFHKHLISTESVVTFHNNLSIDLLITFYILEYLYINQYEEYIGLWIHYAFTLSF